MTYEKADALFADLNQHNQNNGKIENTNVSLFLDGNNTYNLDLKFGAEPGGITEHLKQLINENDASSNQSLQHLKYYLKGNNIISAHNLQSNQISQITPIDSISI